MSLKGNIALSEKEPRDVTRITQVVENKIPVLFSFGRNGGIFAYLHICIFRRTPNKASLPIVDSLQRELGNEFRVMNKLE